MTAGLVATGIVLSLTLIGLGFVVALEGREYRAAVRTFNAGGAE